MIGTDSDTGKVVSRIMFFQETIVECINEVIDMFRTGKIAANVQVEFSDLDSGAALGWCIWHEDKDMEEYGYYWLDEPHILPRQ